MNLTINGLDMFYESLNQHKNLCVEQMKKNNGDDKNINSEITTINNLQSNLLKLRKLLLKKHNN